MTVIDSHAHFEPQLLDLDAILQRMDSNGIDATALIAAVTLDPIYKKPDYLMAIQRFMIQTPILWTAAKIVDRGFHREPGSWNPWYRKFLFNKASYQISQNPDNFSVFKAVDKAPDRLFGWIFVNPTKKMWREEITKFSDHPRAIGIKIHPFWHRYSITKAVGVAQIAREKKIPLMIHSGFDDLPSMQTFIHSFDDLRIIFSHAAFPFYQRLWPIIKTKPNISVDISSHHVDRSILRRCLKSLGPEKLIFGTDDPYGEKDFGIRMQKWIASLNLPEAEAQSILSENFLQFIDRK